MTSHRSDGWGPWRLDRTDFELVTDPKSDVGYEYPIDLLRCTTSAEVLDRICQVAGKTWATDEVIAGLVRAFDEILHPQGTLCGSGRHLTMSVEDVKYRVRSY